MAHFSPRDTEIIAKAFLGEPNKALSRGDDLRFGTNGSTSVDLAKSEWYDHEHGDGGDMIKLIRRSNGDSYRMAIRWLQRQGIEDIDAKNGNGDGNGDGRARGNGHARGNGGEHARDIPYNPAADPLKGVKFKKGGEGSGDGAEHNVDAKFRFVQAWTYTDENGAELFEVVRQENGAVGADGKRLKRYLQRRKPTPTEPPEDIKGGYVWSVKGVRQVPYRLPELLDAIRRGLTVYIAEGEKCADALAELGVPATTGPMGANKFTDELARYFKDADVAVLPDNDEPGRAHAKQVRDKLQGIAWRVRAVELPGLPQKGDIADFIAGGGTLEQLLALVDAAADVEVAEQERNIPQRKRKKAMAPASSDERGPIMTLLDAALASDEPEPPMRDLDNHMVEVLLREPLGLHALTADAANDEDDENSRLPPPPTHMITAHDSCSLALLIEEHIEFVRTLKGGGERQVALQSIFINHYMAYRNSKLPKVGALMTLPVVLPNGELLATNGLDRKRKIVFRIEPGIVDLAPRGKILGAEVAEAMTFLCDEWLCDVQAGFESKCVLIALALSCLERLLLPERPAFFVTAGKRGGGKTTALNMLAAAITGSRAAAMAWSPDPNERRKALLPLLRQNCPMVVFDNIKKGAAISCPHIEKILTCETYEDRVLGESRTERASAATILTFTGNNVGPKGDLSSRSLIARIDVDRPDPENREFKHPDPIAWTLDHRGQILAALYTLLLGARQKKEQPQGRFKAWQKLVGAAIEHAADLVGQPVNFAKMFLAVEADDEESESVVDVLHALNAKWPRGAHFRSAYVAEYIKTEGDECDATRTLKAFIDPRGEGKASSAVTVTARLRAIVDAPQTVNGEQWTLRSGRDSANVREFWVETRGSDLLPL
jgi:hypothetical protein